MRHTAVETLWHDNGTEIIVPAGEPVEMVLADAIPKADRQVIETGIYTYKKQGRDFVGIKIRNWYAMIDIKMLK